MLRRIKVNYNRKEVLLRSYILFYILLYIGYFLFIIYFHSSYSLLSIPAILFPFLLLLFWIIFLLKRSDYHDARKSRLKHILIFGSIITLFCFILLSFNQYNSQFTSERWLNNSVDRVNMIDDFLNDHNLLGMKKDEVFALLGSPDRRNNTDLLYNLGSERGLIRIDSEQLVVQLNEDNLVIGYKITTD